MDDSSSSSNGPTAPWKTWGQLVRLPASITLLADLLAAHGVGVASHYKQPEFLASHLFGRHWLVLVLISLPTSLALYWAGMILNDWFDVEQDRAQRSKRPLASGAISVQTAGRVGWALLLVGVLWCAIGSFYLAQGTNALGSNSRGILAWLPAFVAVLVAISIVLYDGPLKQTIFAPWLMGLCRGLNWLLVYLLGYVAAGGTDDPFPWFPWPVIAGMTCYIAGVTWFARREAVQSDRRILIFGVAVCMVGIGLLSILPRVDSPLPIRVDPDRVFTLVIILVGALIMRRMVMAVLDPTPGKVQMAVRNSLMSLVFLDATLALLTFGTGLAVPIALLVFPGLLLGRWFRTT